MTRPTRNSGSSGDAGRGTDYVAGGQTALEQLFRSEFGSSPEIFARVILIVIAGVALYLYAGWWVGPIWSVAYLMSQAFAYAAMRRRPVPERPIDRALGYAGYMITTGIYIALPAGLMTTDDIMLAFCGSMGVITLGVFTLWREEPPKALLVFDIGIGVAAAVLALAIFLPLEPRLFPRALMVIFAAVAAGYYTMALITTRRTKVQLKAAARRGIEAQKMEAIGRLSGGVAHDFNNILTVLQGNLELYNEVQDENERRKLIADAHQATQRAAGLVTQLLAFARRAPLSATRIEAKAVIEELTAMATRLLPATITVFPAVPTMPTHVLADHDQLVSSLLNLVLNARDALDGRGEITVAVTTLSVGPGRAQYDLAPGRYVRFRVSDNGPGMPPEVAARALEPFFTTKPVGAGSGLGLPTAKGFAEQSGGTLVVDTGTTGTEVALVLPEAHGTPPPPPPLPDSTAKGPP